MNILVSSLTQIYQDNRDLSPLYLRGLFKEELQNYCLSFLYNSKIYNSLIFTGGTCLRKVYGLNRLSEDLDFDYPQGFNISQCLIDLTEYFSKSLDYKHVKGKISTQNNTIFLKLPILKELNIYTDHTPEDLLIRLDFSPLTLPFSTSPHLISTRSEQFLVTAYDLPTLFANKINAFLNRNFFKGKFQNLPFKGRDVYDLFWLCELSSKSSYALRPNQDRLSLHFPTQTNSQIQDLLIQKLKTIDPQYVHSDLANLIFPSSLLEGFVKNYQSIITTHIPMILS